MLKEGAVPSIFPLTSAREDRLAKRQKDQPAANPSGSDLSTGAGPREAGQVLFDNVAEPEANVAGEVEIGTEIEISAEIETKYENSSTAVEPPESTPKKLNSARKVADMRTVLAATMYVQTILSTC